MYIWIIAVCILWGGMMPAHAYLEPGATSLVLQWLIAGIAAMTTVLSIFFHRIKMAIMNFFSRFNRK
jgi:hypothetical protein